MTPASTLKVLTAEAALIYLGPDYRFSTQLLTDAKKVSDGVLKGNLYIILSGDPTLTYFDLQTLLNNLKTKRIEAIEGNVYIDDSAYDQQFYGPGWGDKDKSYCYGAPISASIINRNCLALKIAPGKSPGRPAQITTYANYFYPRILSSVITKSNHTRGCALHMNTQPSNILAINGCMPKGYVWGLNYVVTRIGDYNQALFKNLLFQTGVRVIGRVTFGSTQKNLSLLGAHASKPLRLLINDMMKKSDNVIAGALFKKIGQLYTHHEGSWESGRVAVSLILSHHAKVNINGLKILDGSGLSPDNLATPLQMMQVLDFAYHHYATSYEFISSLPISGIDGTLKHRMANIPRKVRAKTGTISGVTSLVGYTVSAEKEPLAFVIMINGDKDVSWHYKALEDRIANALTRYVRGM